MTRADTLAALAVTLAAVAGTPALAAPLPSLTIYRLPDDLMSDVAIEPERVPAMHGVRKVVVRNPATIAAVRDAVRRAHPTPAGPGAHSVDTRWSLVFHGTSGATHVACDRGCAQGLIDGKRVRFSGTGLESELRSLVP